MSKKRKAEDETKDSKKQKLDPNSQEAWLDGILGKQALGDLAAKAPEDLKDGKHSFKQYEDVFSQIAQRLLNEVVVMINGKPHRFIELEFYYQSANHPDHFTHGHPVQSKFGKWYFHRTGHKMSGYKGGSYKGMDISIGGHSEHADSKVKEKTIHGGILVRAIQPLFKADGEEKKKKSKKESFIEGPSTVVDYILSQCGSSGIEAFVNEHFKGQENTPSAVGSKMFYIASKDKASVPKLSVYSSPRVGLTLKRNLDFGERFLMSSYRFHSLAGSMSKGKQHMILSLHLKKKSSADVGTITGANKATVDKYIEQFKKGEKSGKKLNTFGAGKKTFSPEDFAGLYGAWSASFGAL